MMKYPIVHNKLLRLYLYLYDVICYIIAKIFIDRKNDILPINNNSRILLSNMAAIGDVLYTLRCASVIKKQYPNVVIGMICSSSSSQLVLNCKDVDNVYIVDHWGLNRSKKNIGKKIINWLLFRKRAIEKIRKDKYDYAVDCYYYYPSSSLIFFQAKIKNTIGYDSNGGAYLLSKKIHWNCENIHNIEYQARLISLIGIDYSDLSHSLCDFITRCNDSELFSKLNINPSKSVVIAIGVGASARELDFNKWKIILEYLVKKGKNIILTGYGDKEYRLIKHLKSSIDNGNIISVCNKVDIIEMVQIVRNAYMFIGLESSAGHIAAMYKIKQISLMHGSTNLYHWQPYANNNCIVIRKQISCSPCYSPRYCKKNNACMDLSIEDILFNINKMLSSC